VEIGGNVKILTAAATVITKVVICIDQRINSLFQVFLKIAN